MTNFLPFPEYDMEYLQRAANVVQAHDVSFTDEQLFDLMKIKHRWPKGSVEVINQAARTSDRFYCEDRFLIFNEWKKLYDLGFTSILCNVMDLTQQLRDLDEKLLAVKGSYTNANLYLSNGSKEHRVSFPQHKHDYHVVVKGIYGKTIWQIGEKVVTLNPGEIFVLPVDTPHAVVETPDPRLTLTINVSG
jgi:mannose-6-phosphate isomerase-like protein (cupin superfamily)